MPTLCKSPGVYLALLPTLLGSMNCGPISSEQIIDGKQSSKVLET
jgi:hypothetical protein